MLDQMTPKASPKMSPTIVPLNRSAANGNSSVIDLSKHIALMDENGIWRQVPESSLPHTPYAVRMRITPGVAAEILRDRNPKNRPIESRRVARYIADITSGRWHVHGSSIQFNREGSLIDGQHRLRAVMMSGQSADFMMTFGISNDAAIAIDEGRPRSNTDVARIIGMDGINKFGMSIAAYTLEHAGVKASRSRSDILQFVQRHKEAISFVTDRLNTTGMVKAPVGAVLFRAFYSLRNDKSSLARFSRFIELLQTKSSDLVSQSIPDSDTAPITLREFLLRSNGKSTGTFRKEVYNKTQSALSNFMNNTPIVKLYGTSKELYPLPEEVAGTGL